jgi:hypothetical protein
MNLGTMSCPVGPSIITKFCWFETGNLRVQFGQARKRIAAQIATRKKQYIAVDVNDMVATLKSCWINKFVT